MRKYGRGIIVNFYEKYVALCNARGMSPSAAAEAAGTTRAAVSRWKKGSIPNDTTILVLADYFGVKPIDLFPDERNKFGAESRNLDTPSDRLGLELLKDDERLLLESYRTMGDAERFAMQIIAKRLKED